MNKKEVKNKKIEKILKKVLTNVFQCGIMVSRGQRVALLAQGGKCQKGVKHERGYDQRTNVHNASNDYRNLKRLQRP